MTWGQVTAAIYGLIQDSKYSEAIKVLEEQIRIFPGSHAATSLLGYCHYMNCDYHAATSMYEQLIRLHPAEERYRLYHAQSLFKAEMLDEAAKACLNVEEQKVRIINLQACILYEKCDITGSIVLLEQIADNNLDALVNLGCCLYKEGDFQGACTKFTTAVKIAGFQPRLIYMKALCMFRLKQYSQAMKALTEIFDHGMKEYPELGIGSYVEGMELRSVGNNIILKESTLVEAFNLKAAILYTNGDMDAAKEALDDMPPRAEEELDPVTLHNQALINMDTDPTAGFRKLNFLLQNQCFPQETFGNLLLLYCKPIHGFYDLAADVMAENADLTFKYLTQELYDFLDASILVQTDAEEAYTKFSNLANHHCEVLRRLAKLIQDTRVSQEQEAHKQAVSDYEEALDKYEPVVMAMAKIWWDKEDYVQVERIFRQSADLCSGHELWKLNIAHTLFMQENKYSEAIQYYEPIVKEAGDNVLAVTAIVLANLCVSYIMTSQNEEAEDLMRKIEKAEEWAHYDNAAKQNLHLCIVNLVIGTLYCVKQNFEFGIGRVIKSLEPCSEKIETDTWFYAKRCFLALIDNLAKQMVVLKDTTFADIDDFLDQTEVIGKNIPTQTSNVVYPSRSSAVALSNTNASVAGDPCVSQEVRLLKHMFLQLCS